jgi:G3E family GTPase
MSASMITPVTLLTGFLGSGKTTLLNRILQSPELRETAVLINEFGEVPIDHLLVRESSEQIEVLANGCICCSVAGDMVRTLRDLFYKRANGEVPHFRRVIIETTGLANPAPIMHTLIEMPLVAARYALSGVVTTVDAGHGMKQLSQHPESLKQAAVADRIVITKRSLASKEEYAALEAALREINPAALLFDAESATLSPMALLDAGLHSAGSAIDKGAQVKRWLNAEAYRQVESKPNLLSRTPASSPAHKSNIQSFSMRIEASLDWDELINAIEMIQAMRGDNLLRMKGIIHVAGEAKPRALHAVEHTIYPAATLSDWPDDDRASKLVFIMRDLSPQFIIDTLHAYVAVCNVGEHSSASEKSSPTLATNPL